MDGSAPEELASVTVTEWPVTVKRTVTLGGDGFIVTETLRTDRDLPMSVRVVDPLPDALRTATVDFQTGDRPTAGTTSEAQVAFEAVVPADETRTVRYRMEILGHLPGPTLTSATFDPPRIEGATPTRPGSGSSPSRSARQSIGPDPGDGEPAPGAPATNGRGPGEPDRATGGDDRPSRPASVRNDELGRLYDAHRQDLGPTVSPRRDDVDPESLWRGLGAVVDRLERLERELEATHERDAAIADEVALLREDVECWREAVRSALR